MAFIFCNEVRCWIVRIRNLWNIPWLNADYDIEGLGGVCIKSGSQITKNGSVSTDYLKVLSIINQQQPLGCKCPHNFLSMVWCGTIPSPSITTPNMTRRVPVFGTRHMKMIWRWHEDDMKTVSSPDFVLCRVIVDLSVYPEKLTTYSSSWGLPSLFLTIIHNVP